MKLFSCNTNACSVKYGDHIRLDGAGMQTSKRDIIEIFKGLGLDYKTLETLLDASPSSQHQGKDNK
jgi:hypothetical protein